MKSARLRLLEGSLLAFEHHIEYTPDLRAAGVTERMFAVLTGDRVWRGQDVELCRRAMEGVLSCAFLVSGVARYAVTAEYLAAMIVSVVKPANWAVAAYIVGTGLDGTRLMLPDGDDVSVREYVTPERQFALVLAAADLQAETEDQHEATAPVHEEGAEPQ